MTTVHTQLVPRKIRASSDGEQSLATVTSIRFPGTVGRESRVAFIATCTDTTLVNYLHLRTGNGVLICVLPPMQPIRLEITDDVQIYNPNGGSVTYVFAEEIEQNQILSAPRNATVAAGGQGGGANAGGGNGGNGGAGYGGTSRGGQPR